MIEYIRSQLEINNSNYAYLATMHVKKLKIAITKLIRLKRVSKKHLQEMYQPGDSAVFQYAPGGGFWSVRVNRLSATGLSAAVTIDGIIVPPPHLEKWDPITMNLIHNRDYNIAIAELMQRTSEIGDDLIRAAFDAKIAARRTAVDVHAKAAAKAAQHAHLVVGNAITWTSTLYMGMGIPDETKEFTGVIKAIDRTNYAVTITSDGRDILMDATQLPKN